MAREGLCNTMSTMNPTSANPVPRRGNMALYALTVGAFGIGMTEFIIMGLLPNVADNLHVTIPAAGLLITGYALGVAIGAPILTVATHKMPRKALLLMLMGIFIVGNGLSALAPNYSVLMIARVIAALAHGSFFGVGSVVASELVPKERRAAAIATMFTGLTLANILGVPIGTFLEQHYGWRSTFWLITALGFVALLGIIQLVPRVEAATSSLKQELSVLRSPRVIVALCMTVFGFGGVFTAFTYITPILENITKFSPGMVSIILVIFGVGITVGNIYGGKLADRKLMPSLTGILVLLAIILAVFSITDENKPLAIFTILVWGAAAFGIVPGLQVRTLNVAKAAPTVASALNIAAFNLGNAGGAFLGGVIISGISLRAVPIAAALITVVGILLALVSMLQDRARRA